MQFAGQAEPHSVKICPFTGHVHFSGRTQELVASSITVPLGHSHPGTHWRVQIGLGLVQVGGQAEPHLVKTWPFTGHTKCKGRKKLIRSHFIHYMCIKGRQLETVEEGACMVDRRAGGRRKLTYSTISLYTQRYHSSNMCCTCYCRNQLFNGAS